MGEVRWPQKTTAIILWTKRRHLQDADWFYAENDADAVARIIASHPDSQSEVWHGIRLVASIKPGCRPAELYGFSADTVFFVSSDRRDVRHGSHAANDGNRRS